MSPVHVYCFSVSDMYLAGLLGVSVSFGLMAISCVLYNLAIFLARKLT